MWTIESFLTAVGFLVLGFIWGYFIGKSRGQD